jgi:hypothetical protein
MSGLRTIWLVEITAHDGTGEITLRYSDAGYTSKPSDTPANAYYEARVADPGSITRSIFANGTTFGDVSVGYGQITLENADGGLDALRGYGYGRTVKVYSITALQPTRQPLSAAVLRFEGIVSHREADFDEIRLVLRDALGLLAVPLQEDSFDGSSTGITGIEGNANIEGLIKPMSFGAGLRNIAPVLVNASKEVYGWNFDRLGATKVSAGLTALRNGGATYTLSGTDLADEAALFAASVPSAQADTALAESLLRVNGSVTAQLTADLDVAPDVENLLAYSEQIDNAAWIKSAATVSANAATAPDGNVTADKIVESATTDLHGVYRTLSKAASAKAYVGSIYLEAAERSWAFIWIYGTSSGNRAVAWINLATGAVSAVASVGAFTGTTAEVEDLGSGRYRLIVRTTTDTSTGLTFLVASDISAGGTSYLGDGASGIYAWGAMLHEGTEAKPYIRTEAAAVTLRCEATAARVAAAILAEHGYAIDPASLLALDAAATDLVGLYLPDPITVLDAAALALESVGGYLIADQSGAYKVGRFQQPAGTVRKAITADLILDDSDIALELIPVGDSGVEIPVYKLTLGYSPNWTPQDADGLAGSVSQDDRTTWAAERLAVSVSDTAVQTKHPEALERDISTALVAEAAASAEATRRLTFWKSELTRFRVPLAASQSVYDSDGATPLDIGDRVTLDLGRYGFTTATDFLIIGIDQRFGADEVILDLINSSAW